MSPVNRDVLLPRNGHTFRILAICRISTEHQDERSLEDQEAMLRKWIKLNYPGQVEVHVFASRDSGEALDRAEYLQAIEMVESRTVDLVIMEDSGRFARRNHAVLFCEICEDAETRLVALNDNIDTSEDNWRVNAGFASLRHELYNKDTAARIRRTLQNRFVNGGMLLCTIYGYMKPAKGATDNDVVRLPEAEPVYDRWFTMLEEGATYAEVADWLNSLSIKPGKYSTNTRWDGAMVGRITHNTVLKGLRQFNRTVRKRINKTGRRRAVKADPVALTERVVPHLAFIEPSRYDRVIRMLKERNAKFSRRDEYGIDSRRNVPRKRTAWPGQHVECGICGRVYYFGAHGRSTGMMCSGARDHKCWNGAAFDGPLAAQKLVPAVLNEIEALQGFDELLIAEVAKQLDVLNSSADARRTTIVRDLGRSEREVANVVAAIREGYVSPTLRDELVRLEGDRARLKTELDSLDQSKTTAPKLPPIDDLKRTARELVVSASPDSPEFSRIMQRLLPRIRAYPARILGSGRVVIVAHVTMTLSSLISQTNGWSGWRPTMLSDNPNRVATH
jgi:DNA invertase Pin-like site-specific DNA recombinase